MVSDVIFFKTGRRPIDSLNVYDCISCSQTASPGIFASNDRVTESRLIFKFRDVGTPREYSANSVTNIRYNFIGTIYFC
jgi:hypothetical protein